MTFKILLVVLCLFTSFLGFSQNQDLEGTVMDMNGGPLPGASVYLKGINKGTITNDNGDFILTNCPAGEQELIVSFIGFNPVSKILNFSVHQKKLVIKLSENKVMLQGMVVTAQKREQSIVEIPSALTSVDASFLKSSSISQVDELADFVPGLEVQLQSPNNPSYVIRGITSDSGDANVEPRVSVFQDGVSISKSRGSVVEIYDMDRVEVLKGPQGTLFGRGAEIGAIHFIQNKAKNNRSAALTLGYGDYNYMHAEGFVNSPIVKDKLFARVAGIYKKHDGFIPNLSGGRLNGKDTRAFRVSLRYKPATRSTIDVIYNYQHDTPPGTAFKSGTYAPAGGDTNAWTAADLDKGKELGVDRTVWGTTVLGKFQLSPSFRLNNITAYREFDSYESFDADGTAAPALWFAEDAFGQQFSEELRGNLKIGDRFEGFGGVSYFYENGFSHVPFETNEESLAVLMSSLVADEVNSSILTPINELLSTYGITDEMSFTAEDLLTDGVPNTVSSLPDFISNNQYLAYLQNTAYSSVYDMLTQTLNTDHKESYTNYGKNHAVEIFADGTWKATERLKVTAGIRLTMEHLTSAYKATTDSAGTLGFARSAGTNDLFMPTSKISDSGNYVSAVGRLALNYDLVSGKSIYATVARGRRPNVIEFESEENGDYTSTYYSEKLHDEIVWSYEAGMKSLSTNGQFYYDFAAFFYDYSHFQTSTVDDNLQSVTVDAGNAKSYGAELSLRYRASKLVSLFGNYAYIHARFDDTDDDGNEQEYAGNTFRLTPEHSFALGGTFSVGLNSNSVGFIRPTWNYKSKVYFEEDNGSDVEQDGYGIVNLKTGIKWIHPSMSLQFFANNLLNKHYLIDAGNTGRNFGIPTYIAGSPSLVGIEYSINF